MVVVVVAGMLSRKAMRMRSSDAGTRASEANVSICLSVWQAGDDDADAWNLVKSP